MVRRPYGSIRRKRCGFRRDREVRGDLQLFAPPCSRRSHAIHAAAHSGDTALILPKWDEHADPIKALHVSFAALSTRRPTPSPSPMLLVRALAAAYVRFQALTLAPRAFRSPSGVFLPLARLFSPRFLLSFVFSLHARKAVHVQLYFCPPFLSLGTWTGRFERPGTAI